MVRDALLRSAPHHEELQPRSTHRPHPEEHRQRVRPKAGPMTSSAMRLEGWLQSPIQFSNSRRSQRSAAPVVCFQARGGPASHFPSPLDTRGWSAGRRQGGTPPLYGRLTRPAGRTSRPASTPTAISPLPRIAAIGVRAASDVGRCASRGSTATPLSGAAPCSVIDAA
jgi:hypothetical protein